MCRCIRLVSRVLTRWIGVTTGFGGSADTRTRALEDLQLALLQHLHIGILTDFDRGKTHGQEGEVDRPSHAMPESWVRATILIRCNTVSRGHSAVSMKVIETVSALLENEITPIVPLRGSISASGDLSPLSYIAGAVTGNPDIHVQAGRSPHAKKMPADEALKEKSIQPVSLGPKEGLGLLNGTATSAAVGSLALFDSHNLALLSQVLSSMSVEALLGSHGSFDPFIAAIRPHPGQTEVATNIRFLLEGSQLARGLHLDDSRTEGLYQDRYPLRTSSQWLGPQLEDLLLAHKQVTTELNSTTDNPLIDVSNRRIHHGGNFQATSITSAMEKTRLALQMIGKLMFAQCSELINPTLSNGLPPNLSADEPSLSFTCKGIDTSMAAYMSELAFLANPVSSHVQSAEMNNQAVNSLALISARYTLQAAEIVTLMASAYIYVLCQALDLRAMLLKFSQRLKPELDSLTTRIWGSLSSSTTARDDLSIRLWKYMWQSWTESSHLDAAHRAAHVSSSSLSVISAFFTTARTPASVSSDTTFLPTLAAWNSAAEKLLLDTYTSVRTKFFSQPDTATFLGKGSRCVYSFVREELGVPFNRGLVELPRSHGCSEESGNGRTLDGRAKKNIGSWISDIHGSLVRGDLFRAVVGLKGRKENDELGDWNGKKMHG